MPIPAVLSDPPWRAHKAEKPAAPATRAAVSQETALVWVDGEQAAFAGKPGARLNGPAEEKAFEKLLDELDKQRPLRAADVARLGDEKLAELADELGPTTCDVATLKILLGRLGEAFVRQAVTLVRSAARERGLFEGALPIRSGELARTAAAVVHDREVTTTPYAASAAETWLLRHAEVAAAALTPMTDEVKSARSGLAFIAAHGKLPGSPLASLEPLVAKNGWLAVLLAQGHEHRVAAMVEGEPAAEAFLAKVRSGGIQKKLEPVTFAVAALPPFFDASSLPHPKLKEGGALTDDALRALGEMLRFSPLLNPYAGIEQVRDACDAASLDELALALLARWSAAGEDSKEIWALESCGKIGSDGSAREIATRVRSWARGADPRVQSHGWAYARAGCNVLHALAERGHSKVARVLLDDIARTGVQIWLRKEAQRLTGSEAVSRDELEAQVPTFGLDEQGTATFDVGSAVYRLGFDEGLAPHLVTDGGERVDSFPRQRKGMDAGKYAEAKSRFTAMVKDAKTVARYQVALIDRTMCEQRPLSVAAFRERYVQHPLLRHLGKRVVWSTQGRTFRVADDGSLADIDDAPLTLSDDARVIIIHPVMMKADERNTWQTRFGDYRVMQPFPQLGRETFTVLAEEIGEHDIARVVSRTTVRGRLFQLGRRGWHTPREDVNVYERELPCGAMARFTLSQPVAHDASADQTYTVVAASCTYALDRLPALDYSELMRDLEYAVSS